ncbi:MAG: hypothetical protein ACYCZM_04620 [Acidimicrobiales bacterium]
MAIHLHGDMEWALVSGAFAIFALSVITKGPLGATRLIGPRFHLVLDIVLATGLALSPLIARSGVDAAGIITVEAAAVLLARMSLLTRHTPRVKTPASPSSASPPPGPPSRPSASTWLAPSTSPSPTLGTKARTPMSSPTPGGAPVGPPSAREVKAMATVRALGFLAGRAARRSRKN